MPFRRLKSSRRHVHLDARLQDSGPPPGGPHPRRQPRRGEDRAEGGDAVRRFWFVHFFSFFFDDDEIATRSQFLSHSSLLLSLLFLFPPSFSCLSRTVDHTATYLSSHLSRGDAPDDPWSGSYASSGPNAPALDATAAAAAGGAASSSTSGLPTTRNPGWPRQQPVAVAKELCLPPPSARRCPTPLANRSSSYRP